MGIHHSSDSGQTANPQFEEGDSLVLDTPLYPKGGGCFLKQQIFSIVFDPIRTIGSGSPSR